MDSEYPIRMSIPVIEIRGTFSLDLPPQILKLVPVGESSDKQMFSEYESCSLKSRVSAQICYQSA